MGCFSFRCNPISYPFSLCLLSPCVVSEVNPIEERDKEIAAIGTPEKCMQQTTGIYPNSYSSYSLPTPLVLL